MRVIEDFFRYLIRLIKDWVFLGSTIYGVASWLLDTYAQLPGGYAPFLSRWFYGTVWGGGFVFAAYRLDRSLRNQISSEDIIVEHRWFTEKKEPELVRQGFRVNYPAPSAVHRLSLDGWQEIHEVDKHGTRRRYVIGDDASRIYNIPMRKNVRVPSLVPGTFSAHPDHRKLTQVGYPRDSSGP